MATERRDALVQRRADLHSLLHSDILDASRDLARDCLCKTISGLLLTLKTLEGRLGLASSLDDLFLCDKIGDCGVSSRGEALGGLLELEGVSETDGAGALDLCGRIGDGSLHSLGIGEDRLSILRALDGFDRSVELAQRAVHGGDGALNGLEVRESGSKKSGGEESLELHIDDIT